MSHNDTKVYMEDGGSTLVIDNGGAVQFLTGSKFFGNAGTQTADVGVLTDNSGGGAADGTIGAITALATAGGNTYTDAAVNAKLQLVADAITELATKINALRTAVRNVNITA